jgi:hypothetical protein
MMNKTILALVLIGFAGAAAAQPQVRLSETPPCAIHTPGIGPGYIFPSYGTDVAVGADTMPATPMTSMMPGAAPMTDHISTMSTGEVRASAILREQGFTNVQNLRQAPDGSWHGIVLQRGGSSAVSVSTDGVVSLRQQ